MSTVPMPTTALVPLPLPVRGSSAATVVVLTACAVTVVGVEVVGGVRDGVGRTRARAAVRERCRRS